jgi:hypothetical protein
MNADDAVGTRIGQIMDEGMRLTRTAWQAMLGYVVVLTAVGMAGDQMTDIAAANLLFSVVSTALGYGLTIALLRQGGLSQSTGGFPVYFGLSLLFALGVGLGLIVLVIPGLVLFVRWAPVFGIVLGERAGIGEGFNRAWEQTRGHGAPLALALLVPVGINIAAVTVYVLAGDEQGIIAMPVSAVANMAMSVAGAGITVVGIAGYALLRDRSADIAEVFA